MMIILEGFGPVFNLLNLMRLLLFSNISRSESNFHPNIFTVSHRIINVGICSDGLPNSYLGNFPQRVTLQGIFSLRISL